MSEQVSEWLSLAQHTAVVAAVVSVLCAALLSSTHTVYQQQHRLPLYLSLLSHF